MKRIYAQRVLLGTFKHAVFIIWSIITIYPIFFMIISSLKSKQEYSINHFGLPIHVTFENVIKILFETNFSRWFLNSVIITGSSVLISLIVAILASYGISQYKFKFKITLVNFIISLIIFPPIIMIIPLFVFMVNIDLVNTYYSVILIYTGILLPFSIYTLLGFFKTIPSSIQESAIIDGASSFKILMKIFIPLSKPAIATLATVNSIWVWNELLIALVFMQKAKMRTLIGGLTQFASKYALQVPLLMTGLTLATIPIIILYFSTQKYFLKGLISGALKG